MVGTSIPPSASLLGSSDSNRSSEEANSWISTQIDSLPNELLFDILLLLPADFLYERARFVCRKWHEIIHSDDFIKAQISRSTHGLLLVSESDLNDNHIYVTAAEGRIKISELSCRSRILASSNGLVVGVKLENGIDSLHVINPATKQTFTVPSPSRSVYLYDCGIAHSAASMKYKLALPYSNRQGTYILTLGVDKSWRDIGVEHSTEDDKRFFRVPRLTNEGFLHWQSIGKKYMVTMNVETEIFTVSQAQAPQSYPSHLRFYLPTERFLTLLVKSGNWWEIWEMKPESGEWRKLEHKIGLEAQKKICQQGFSSSILEEPCPLGWVKYPEVLAFRFWGLNSHCVLYDLHTHEINVVNLPDSFVIKMAVPHRNNPVWLS